MRNRNSFQDARGSAPAFFLSLLLNVPAFLIPQRQTLGGLNSHSQLRAFAGFMWSLSNMELLHMAAIVLRPSYVIYGAPCSMIVKNFKTASAGSSEWEPCVAAQVAMSMKWVPVDPRAEAKATIRARKATRHEVYSRDHPDAFPGQPLPLIHYFL